jgi:hypothetical protein
MAKNLKSERPSLTRYIADREIKTTCAAIRKTNLGNSVVEVVFTDGEKKEYPEIVFKKIVSTSPTNLTEIRDRVAAPLAEELLALLLEYEVNICDIENLFQLIQFSLNKNFDKADDVLWGKGSRERTLYDVNKVLQNGEKTKVPSSGGGDKSDKIIKI